MPRISPLYAVKDTSLSFTIPSSLRTVRPFTSRRGCGLTGSGLVMFNVTLWPTIMSVISCAFVSFVIISPTKQPRRSTATRSERLSTSCILWVIMTIDFPSFRIFRSTANSFSVSCGVSTAVGSSRIRISAPRYSTLMISTVCFCETDML